ncbi:MAG: hypothetical protein A2X43_11650 [Candidatus Margulisbacteria bacterium GWD2_39_127]|nr:MAG: hypothetical protein A2X43_11650 [Candidatus Margulisbacteria bacterium GWD2_39_127]
MDNNYFKSIVILFRSLLHFYCPYLLKKKKLDFAFLIHVRYPEDYYTGLACLNIFQKILPQKIYYYLIQKLPPQINDVFQTTDGLHGIIISTLKLPSELLNQRISVKRELRKFRKIIGNYCKETDKQIIIGLGGWWPIATANGKIAQKVFEDHKFNVTTGHTGTVLSICNMANSLSKLGFFLNYQTNVAIIGIGNIGMAIAHKLLENKYKLTLIDINTKKLHKMRDKLLEKHNNAEIRIEHFDRNNIKSILDNCHLGVCATSSQSKILSEKDIPNNFVFIDDSRPEAIPRFDYCPILTHRYTLEGGLFNIPSINLNYDIGIGTGPNVLGCLAESYMLALAQATGQELPATIGSIVLTNVDIYDDFCRENNINNSDYLMGAHIIDKAALKGILVSRLCKILQDEHNV